MNDLEVGTETQDEICFLDEDAQAGPDAESGAPWKLLIVDDEPEFHTLTQLVLEDFTFKGRKLEFLSAYDGAEARDVLRQHPDTAVILLDVVMETDHAGLDVVRFIREELQNDTIQIVLRTGQPGCAPEREVMTNFEIDDYKSKAELTSDKLFITMIARLRTYQLACRLQENINQSVAGRDAAGVGCLQVLTEAMPVLLAVLDEGHRPRIWNDRCVRLTGLTRDDVEINPDRLREVFPDWIWAIPEDGEIAWKSGTIRAVDGTSRQLFLAGSVAAGSGVAIMAMDPKDFRTP